MVHVVDRHRRPSDGPTGNGGLIYDNAYRSGFQIDAPTGATITRAVLGGVDALQADRQRTRINLLPQPSTGQLDGTEPWAKATDVDGDTLTGTITLTPQPGFTAATGLQVRHFPVACGDPTLSQPPCAPVPAATTAHARVQSVTLTLDDPSAPTATLNGPAGGWTNATSATVTAGGQDPQSGISRLSLTVKSGSSTRRPVIGTWNQDTTGNSIPGWATTRTGQSTVALPRSGAVTVTSVARNGAGTESTSTPIAIRVDRTAPTITWPRKLEGGQTATVRDSESGLASLTAKVGSKTVTTSCAAGAKQCKVKIPTTADGTLRITITDQAGNDTDGQRTVAPRPKGGGPGGGGGSKGGAKKPPTRKPGSKKPTASYCQKHPAASSCRREPHDACRSAPASKSCRTELQARSPFAMSGARSLRRGRTKAIGMTLIPYAQANARRSVQSSKVGTRSVTKVVCVPALGSGVPCLTLTLDASASYTRYNDAPRSLDISTVSDLSPSTTTQSFGSSLTMRATTTDSAKEHRICKGDVAWSGCAVTLNFSAVPPAGERRGGQVYKVGSTGCTVTGRVNAFHCFGTNWERSGSGLAAGRSTRVDRVIVRAKALKIGRVGQVVGQTIKTTVPFYSLGRPRAVGAPVPKRGVFPWATFPEADQLAAVAETVSTWTPLLRATRIRLALSGAREYTDRLKVTSVAAATADGCRKVDLESPGLTSVATPPSFNLCPDSTGQPRFEPLNDGARAIATIPRQQLARGAHANAVAYVSRRLQHRRIGIVVPGELDQIAGLPGTDPVSRAAVVALSGASQQSSEISVLTSGRSAPRWYSWNGNARTRLTAAAARTRLVAGCRIQVTWTAPTTISTRATLLRSRPRQIEIDARQCASERRG